MDTSVIVSLIGAGATLLAALITVLAQKGHRNPTAPTNGPIGSGILDRPLAEGQEPPAPPSRSLTEAEKQLIRQRIMQGEANIYTLALEFRCAPMQIAGLKAALTKAKGGWADVADSLCRPAPTQDGDGCVPRTVYCRCRPGRRHIVPCTSPTYAPCR